MPRLVTAAIAAASSGRRATPGEPLTRVVLGPPVLTHPLITAEDILQGDAG